MGQVIVAGGGPTGLWLSAELALAGVEVTVLEKRPRLSPVSRGFTIHPRTMELWASRGIADRFLKEGRTVSNSHFGLLETRMDFSALDTPFPFILTLGQRRVEELLEEHALGLGVDIRRGHAFTGMTPGAESVVVRAADSSRDYTLDGEYVAGCDGAGSLLREAAGIGFPGTESSAVGWVADVTLDAPPAVPYYQHHGPNGCVLAVPLGPGLYRVAGIDAGQDRPADRNGRYTEAELAARVTEVAGADFGLRDLEWFSQTGSATRLAEQYRKGRVFLAGDAAHRVFPAGGVGLNAGVQDAANLGWKLAAAIARWAPEGLLDSYHEERHAAGSALYESTLAQVALMTRFDAETLALRSALSTAIAQVPEFSRHLADQVSGLGTCYPPRSPDQHPLAGHRAPNLRFADGKDLFSLLTAARYVLLDLAGSGTLSSVARTDPTGPAVMVHSGVQTDARDSWEKVRAALIRPDGHVAWASEESDDAILRAAVAAALARTHR